MWDFLKIDLLLNKKYTQNFNERYLKEKKVKDQIRKTVSQKKHTKAWVYTNHSIFLKEVLGLLKLHFTLTELGGTFFAGFFPGVFFSYSKKKTTLEKNSQNLSQWKFK